MHFRYFINFLLCARSYLKVEILFFHTSVSIALTNKLIFLCYLLCPCLQVTIARRRLENINPVTVAAIRTKQAAALILTKEADMVNDMVHEGLLNSKDADEIIATINLDMGGIERKRNKMYQEHGDSSSMRRKELRRLEQISHNSLFANEDI
jgi:hypothetical protein